MREREERSRYACRSEREKKTLLARSTLIPPFFFASFFSERASAYVAQLVPFLAAPAHSLTQCTARMMSLDDLINLVAASAAARTRNSRSSFISVAADNPLFLNGTEKLRCLVLSHPVLKIGISGVEGV